MTELITSRSDDAHVKLLHDETNEETGERVKQTEVYTYMFVTENNEFSILEFCMISSKPRSQTGQMFFCIMVERTAVGILECGEVGVIIILIDGTTIECTQFSSTEDNDTPTGTFTLINIKDPDLSLQIDGLSLSIDPQKAIDANWEKLASTPIARIRVKGSNNTQDYIPNSEFTDFPPQNLIIEHIKALR